MIEEKRDEQNTGRRRGRILKYCLKKNRSILAFCLGISLLDLTVFRLYGMDPEPFLYTSVLSLVFLLVWLLSDGIREDRRDLERRRILASPAENRITLPDAESPLEEDYQEILEQMGRMLEEMHTRFDREQQDTLDYYTAWVHQIKTPITVMRLRLTGEDTEEHRALIAELFRIEQYVDMVLQYIRLGSRTTDLAVQEYPLDDLVREVIRKYASSFIQRRLKLDFQPTGRTIVTDKKWFGLILEQFLSNALKYTSAGTITIRVDESDRLCIEDTGIGIASEDLPRIFEKGFTGMNGRIGEKSSGLGLYLAKRAADLISRRIGAESRPGEGSVFYVDVKKKP